MTTPDHGEQALDDALNMTFPASDPVAVFVPDTLTETQRERLRNTREPHEAAS